jgi:hypothetical protein
MSDEPIEQPTNSEEESYVEPSFDLRRGLKVLIIIGVVVMIISAICISLDSRYG